MRFRQALTSLSNAMPFESGRVNGRLVYVRMDALRIEGSLQRWDYG